MTQLINQLASIKVDDDVARHINVGQIYSNFSASFRKLDDLKNFRNDYEQKNFLSRWWNNDKLRDAQLDSAEVQAEFSKTIGQLMMISIVQSKKLTEQQGSLNDQQTKLGQQANNIERHTQDIAAQQHKQQKQAEDLKTLVNDYFALKGMTDEGAKVLVKIAEEVRSTKASMVETVSRQLQQVRQSIDQDMGRIEDHLGSTHQTVQALTVTSTAHAKHLETLKDQAGSLGGDVAGLQQGVAGLRDKATAAALTTQEISARVSAVQERGDQFDLRFQAIVTQIKASFQASQDQIQKLEADTAQQLAVHASRVESIGGVMTSVQTALKLQASDALQLRQRVSEAHRKMNIALTLAGVAVAGSIATIAALLIR